MLSERSRFGKLSRLKFYKLSRIFFVCGKTMKSTELLLLLLILAVGAALASVHMHSKSGICKDVPRAALSTAISASQKTATEAVRTEDTRR
jgi:hypothetical protein